MQLVDYARMLVHLICNQMGGENQSILPRLSAGVPLLFLLALVALQLRPVGIDTAAYNDEATRKYRAPPKGRVFTLLSSGNAG
jgi:hypothetical protein